MPNIEHRLSKYETEETFVDFKYKAWFEICPLCPFECEISQLAGEGEEKFISGTLELRVEKAKAGTWTFSHPGLKEELKIPMFRINELPLIGSKVHIRAKSETIKNAIAKIKNPETKQSMENSFDI
jgi:hypothetical protein